MVVFGPGWNNGPEMAEPQTIPVKTVGAKVIHLGQNNFLILALMKLGQNNV
jgi:hypothetical protein